MDRYHRLFDPIDQALVFTNSVCESNDSPPEILTELPSIEFDNDFWEYVNERLDCCFADGWLVKLPKDHLNYWHPTKLRTHTGRDWGLSVPRQEKNLLSTYNELSEKFISLNYGFFPKVKINYPYCVVPFTRDGRLIVMDLECEFITTLNRNYTPPMYSETPILTIDTPLTSIAPMTWPSCFAKSNYYPNDFEFKMQSSSYIHSIFMNHLRGHTLKFEDFAGRGILWCYGYAVSQFRKFNNDTIEYKELDDPITINCVLTCNKDFSFTFVYFQLNTTSFNSQLKNQVWIEGPFTEREDILRRFTALNLNGVLNSPNIQIQSNVN